MLNKIISYLIVVSLCFSQSVFASQVTTPERCNLATRSQTQIIDEYRKEFEALKRGGEIPRIGRDFVQQYAKKLVAKIVARANDIANAPHGRQISIDNTEKELVLQINAFVRDNKIPSYRKNRLLEAVRIEFKKLRGEFVESEGTVAKARKSASGANVFSEQEEVLISPAQATKLLKKLPNIATIGKLEKFSKELEDKGLTWEAFMKPFRPELAQMADILRRAKPKDELNSLMKTGEFKIEQLDILRGMSELVLQFLEDVPDQDNIELLKDIRMIFVKYQEI